MKPTSLHTKIFFDKQVHMKAWKDNMSGENEESCLRAMTFLGYELGKDFVRQHPLACRFVCDFAFVPEQIAIEIDGRSHKEKKQREKDRERDMFLYLNGWVVIRIPDQKFNGKESLFYRYLIKEVVEDRRKQLEGGRLYPIDIPEYEN